MTLLSAPAGFGKTTLLADWIGDSPPGERSLGWLSLDHLDNEPTSFWAYVIAALDRAAPGSGVGSLSLLEAPQPPPIPTVLPILLNDLAAAPNDIVLVLDDYHAIDAHEIQEQMTFLLEHLPPQTHLIIATRADPTLPLARLRARGELFEIRAADLRFTQDETTTYMNEVVGLDLDRTALTVLEARTEGWIAALQLAALSMQDRDDIAGFIAGFAGDHRYIVDYLVDEVLKRQPEAVRSFLLQSCILEQLSGSLCDAVTVQTDGKAMLEALERRNMFVVPLDDRREWYRYHRLFADVLRARLADELPDQQAQLHRRASDWYERHDEPSEAIRHALAGEDFERAADVLEVAIPAMRQARQEATMRRWLDALPDEIVSSRPVLGVHRAGVLLANGDLDGAEASLRDAERWLERTEGARERHEAGSSDVVVRDQEGFRRLPSQIAIYRAAQALAVGDIARVVTQAQRALDLAGGDDHFERGAAAGFLALANWRGGHLDEAYGHWTNAKASLRKAGHVADAIGCARPLALIRIAQGRLREAMTSYERGLNLASQPRPLALRGVADMHVGMSELFIEWNDLDAARRHLAVSQELGEHAGLAQNPYRWCVAMSRFRLTQGDLDGALGLLDEAERLYVSEYYPDVRPVAALRARIWASHGRLGDAVDWAQERALTVDDDLSYLREFEHITLARILMGQAAADDAGDSIRAAVELLERLLPAAEDGGRLSSVLEILTLLALSHQQLGDAPAALAKLERALTLAEPEGYVRVFLDDGAPMAALLDGAAKNGIAVEYVRRLLAAHRRADNTSAQKALAEPLSKRELDVLRLLATDLDGPSIANELFVGVSTIRSHTKSVYAKLGVNNRRAAIRRAEELGLLPRASST